MKTYIELGLPGGRIDFLMSERNQVFANKKKNFCKAINSVQLQTCLLNGTIVLQFTTFGIFSLYSHGIHYLICGLH